jgi:outer membrane protein assembly factor BamB
MTRFILAASLAAVASGALALGSAAPATSSGAPPPELTQFANEWPAHNLNLSNTRATTASSINSTNVTRLKPKWRFRLRGAGAFGKFSSNPIVLGNTVYLQDLSSNVYALNRATGSLEWKHTFRRSSVGPNGVAYGYGKLYGATDRAAFALDPANGACSGAGRSSGTGTKGSI